MSTETARCKTEGCMVRRCVGELCWTCHRKAADEKRTLDLAVAWQAWQDAEHAADVAQMRAHNAERDYERVRVETQQRRASDARKGE
jgi:hypothetical protein